MSTLKKTIRKRYNKLQTEELKANVLKLIHRNSYITELELEKQLNDTRWRIDDIVKKCEKEGLIIRIGRQTKSLTRRGIDYINR